MKIFIEHKIREIFLYDTDDICLICWFVQISQIADWNSIEVVLKIETDGCTDENGEREFFPESPDFRQVVCFHVIVPTSFQFDFDLALSISISGQTHGR